MEKLKQFYLDNAPKPVGCYPHARRAGDLLFLSGLGPRSKTDDTIPGVELDEFNNVISYDFEQQCHAVFENVKTVLQGSGCAWNDLIDITVFLTNMKQDFTTFNRLYSDYFQDNQPCRTTVEVGSLPTPIAIELKCIALIRE